MKTLEVEYKTRRGKNQTANAAYVSLIDQIRISLHDDNFFNKAIENTNALPDEWWLPNELQRIISLEKGTRDRALLWKVSHGTHWLENIINHEEHWLPKFNSAKKNIVLQYSFYSDDVKIGAI